MTRRGTGQGPNRERRDDRSSSPPWRTASTSTSRGGSGLLAAASASRRPRTRQRDLAGGGTGSSSARLSEPQRVAARPALPVSHRPRAPPGERSARLQPSPPDSSPGHRESAGRVPTPCPASSGSEKRRPLQPHRLPAAGPEVVGRGLIRDRSGRFKKKKIQSCKELYWQLQRRTEACAGLARRLSLIGGGYDLRAGQGCQNLR